MIIQLSSLNYLFIPLQFCKVVQLPSTHQSDTEYYLGRRLTLLIKKRLFLYFRSLFFCAASPCPRHRRAKMPVADCSVPLECIPRCSPVGESLVFPLRMRVPVVPANKIRYKMSPLSGRHSFWVPLLIRKM